MSHFETYPLFPAPQPHDPVTGRNLGDTNLPTLPQMRTMVNRAKRNKQYLTMTRDHVDGEVGQFTDVWLDESGSTPRVMVTIKFNNDENGMIAQEAVKTRAYDAISAEWKPLKDPQTGETNDILLFGATITDCPRMNGGDGGCFVLGWPDESENNPAKESAYKAPFDQGSNTPNNQINSDMSDTEKASADVAPMDGVTPTSPAKLQNMEEVAAQSHPQDTGRGGSDNETDIKLRSQDHQTLQARNEALMNKLSELEKNQMAWQKYQEEQTNARKQQEQLARQQKLKASMMTMRAFKEKLWNSNNSPLAHNSMFKASADAVASALDTNDVDAFSKIDGIEYFVASANGELEINDQKTKEQEEKRKEQEMRAKIEAEMAQRNQEMMAKQLGMLEKIEQRANSLPLLPPPVSPYSSSTTTTSTASPAQPAAPMEIQPPVVQPMKASFDANMSTQQKQAAMIDSFEAQYGVPRSQCEVVGFRASADNEWLGTLLHSGEGSETRSSGRTQQRFAEIDYASQVLRQAQLNHHRGRLPRNVAPLDLENIFKASMDSQITTQAIPYKARDSWVLENGQRVNGIMIGRYGS
ncbi:MAG: hypothetical protein CMP20_02775 [Rickettsiales bacterium]|nr:hypothetical protein [Rickettsiales bacterium]